MYHIRTYPVRMYTHFYLYLYLIFLCLNCDTKFSPWSSQKISKKFNVFIYHEENLSSIWSLTSLLYFQTQMFGLVCFVLVQKIPVLFNQSIPSCLIFQPFFQQHMFPFKIILITLICVSLCLEGGQEVVVRTARKRKRPTGSGSGESAERMHESGKAGWRVVAAQGRPPSHLSAAQRKGNPRKETCRY